MNEWRKIENNIEQLNNICLNITDGTHASPKKQSFGKPLITSKHLKNGKILVEEANLISEQDFKKINERSKVNQWDVLISMIGTVGELAIVKEEPKFAIKNIGLFNIGNEFVAKWVYYYFSSAKGKNEIFTKIGGSTQQYITLSELRNLKIYFPAQKIREKIIKILSDIDEKIELNTKINDNLEKQAELIFNNYFLKNSFSNILKRDKLLTLSKEIICGKTPATKNKEFYGADVPFITIPDMHNKIYIDSTERSLSFKGADSQNNKYLPINTICVSCIGTAGLVSLTSKISQTNQQINSVIPKETEFTYYIYFLMKSLKDKINLIGASGSTFCNLNKKDFSNLEVPIPNNKILKRFHNSISPLFEKLKENQIENEKLINLKKYLLPKLMNGEIDVENIEL